ncbi:hypothetical protein TWF694_011153 [Orbilia ellipsospora]|uniref:Uncharacterized protein n=1 Tax=Orbilia ellipsospora TaxID=2528407 RepID=A0AAV9XAR9_9PEZI
MEVRKTPTTINEFRTITVHATATNFTTSTLTIDNTATQTAVVNQTVTSSVLFTTTTTRTTYSIIGVLTTATSESTAKSTDVLTSTNIHTTVESDTTTVTSFNSTEIINTNIVPLTYTSSGGTVVKRQNPTFSIPSYAQASCTNLSAYSSACTCIGVTLGGTTYSWLPSTVRSFYKTTTVTSTLVNTITETFTNDVNVTKTATDAFTETISSGTTVLAVTAIPTTSTATVSITITTTVETTIVTTLDSTTDITSLSTVTEDDVTTVTTAGTQYTEFAIQATDDEANGPYKGQYMYSFEDPTQNNDQQVAFTSDFSQAGKYGSNAARNVTAPDTGSGEGLYTVPFVVYDGNSTNTNVLQTSNSSSLGQIGCWYDSAYIFRCEGTGRKFMGVNNSTNNLNLYSDVGNIYTQNSTGPLVLKVVPVPTASTTAPPAAATSLLIKNVATYSDSDYIWGNNFFGTTLEGGFNRVIMTPNQASAKIFLADPATGNLFDQNNVPFSFINNGSNNSPVYSNYPSGIVNMIIGCTLDPAGVIVRCIEGAFDLTTVAAAGNSDAGEVRTWDDPDASLNIAWSMDLVAVLV